MKRLFTIFFFCCFFIITAFLLFGNVEKWIELTLNSNKTTVTFSVLSFCILAADIILPVPSSLIMILNGKMLGLLPGTLLSLLSGLLSSSLGFLIGRRSNPFFDNFFSERDKEISNRLFDKFGNTAITISKALPIFSEAVSLVAGTTAINFTSFFLHSFIGHLFVSFAYAYVGSYSNSINSNLIAAIVIIAALSVSWLMQMLVRKRRVMAP